jgi:hypothetical protein
MNCNCLLISYIASANITLQNMVYSLTQWHNDTSQLSFFSLLPIARQKQIAIKCSNDVPTNKTPSFRQTSRRSALPRCSIYSRWQVGLIQSVWDYTKLSQPASLTLRHGTAFSWCSRTRRQIHSKYRYTRATLRSKIPCMQHRRRCTQSIRHNR